MTTVVIDAAATAIVVAVLSVVVAVTSVIAWAWDRRGATRLDRVLAQCERDREDAMLARLADPALWESMERRVQP